MTGDETATTEEQPTQPVTAEEYRKKWKPELVTTPGMKGSSFLLKSLDPAEYLLLYVDPEDVEKKLGKEATWEEVGKEAKANIKKMKDLAARKLLTTVVVKPKLVEGPATSPDELNIDELREMDKRFLTRIAFERAGLLGRGALKRKFPDKQQTPKRRKHRGKGVSSKTK